MRTLVGTGQSAIIRVNNQQYLQLIRSKPDSLCGDSLITASSGQTRNRLLPAGCKEIGNFIGVSAALQAVPTSHSTSHSKSNFTNGPTSRFTGDWNTSTKTIAKHGDRKWNKLRTEQELKRISSSKQPVVRWRKFWKTEQKELNNLKRQTDRTSERRMRRPNGLLHTFYTGKPGRPSSEINWPLACPFWSPISPERKAKESQRHTARLHEHGFHAMEYRLHRLFTMSRRSTFSKIQNKTTVQRSSDCIFQQSKDGKFKIQNENFKFLPIAVSAFRGSSFSKSCFNIVKHFTISRGKDAFEVSIC